MTASASTTTANGSARAPVPGRRMVDAPMRMFHWLFAASFAGAYLTAESEHWRLVHVTLGYTFAGLLGFRVLYGLFGPRHVRLSALWRRVAGLPAWLRTVTFAARSGASVNWRQAQNLAMGLAMVLMLAGVVPLVLSGLATYNEWGGGLGGDWLEETHEFFGNALLTLVLAHLGLIATLSALRRQNLALPMLTGRAPGAGAGLVQHNRAWLAALLLSAVAGFGAWQWREAPRGGDAAPVREGRGADSTGADGSAGAATPVARRTHRGHRDRDRD